MKLCVDCGLLLLPEDQDKHAKHNIKYNLNISDLHRPSKLLKPLDNKKSNAQFLFSEKATRFIVTTLHNLKFTKVLCIGSPSVHEEIIGENIESNDFSLSSLLLDIDYRFEQFCSPKTFVRYNLFNHYFFGDSDAEVVFRDFICKDASGLVLVMDPPFGGYVEVIAHTMKQISEMWIENNQPSNKGMNQIQIKFDYNII